MVYAIHEKIAGQIFCKKISSKNFVIYSDISVDFVMMIPIYSNKYKEKIVILQAIGII